MRRAVEHRAWSFGMRPQQTPSEAFLRGSGQRPGLKSSSSASYLCDLGSINCPHRVPASWFMKRMGGGKCSPAGLLGDERVRYYGEYPGLSPAQAGANL